MIEQLDFLAQVIPIAPPHWGGSGFWCCPRCWQSQRQKFGHPFGLTFSPDGEYKIGRCACGYWARFEHDFGVERATGRKRVLEYGEEKTDDRTTVETG